MAYRFSDISDIGKYQLFLKYQISYQLQMARLEISDIGKFKNIEISGEFSFDISK